MGFDYPRRFFKYYSQEQQSIIKDYSGSVGGVNTPSPGKKTKKLLLEHSPEGFEVDCYVCCAIRSVKRFAPAIIASQKDELFHSNYLWRAIYPKLKSGKPAYNPSGKYCVRLYLAGKWRKVMVNDQIPLRDDGKIALATSSDPLELWPTILAKAIYTVYSACGYSSLVDDVDESAHISTKMLLKVLKNNHSQITIPHKICSFVSFALHLLTGWQPSSPMSLTSIFLNERTRAAKLLLSITTAGVIEIDPDDIVDDVPIDEGYSSA
jgi:hypothetical protein